MPYFIIVSWEVLKCFGDPVSTFVRSFVRQAKPSQLNILGKDGHPNGQHFRVVTNVESVVSY
jgi:hypothetical protein